MPAGVVMRFRLERAEPLRWALLADLHLAGDETCEREGFRPDEHCRRTVGEVAAWAPHGASIHGDLAWCDGLAEDYRRCKLRLQPLIERLPLALSPGNHDSRQALLEAFFPHLAADAPEKMISIVEAPSLRLISLDSLYRSDVMPGLVGRAQRDWLCEFLDAEDPRPTVVAVHHPLRPDDDALLDERRLTEILEPRRQVKAVLTAHDHRLELFDQREPPVIALPAVGMPFEPDGAIGWLAAEFSRTGARMEFRAWPRSQRKTIELHWREC